MLLFWLKNAPFGINPGEMGTACGNTNLVSAFGWLSEWADSAPLLLEPLPFWLLQALSRGVPGSIFTSIWVVGVWALAAAELSITLWYGHPRVREATVNKHIHDLVIQWLYLIPHKFYIYIICHRDGKGFILLYQRFHQFTLAATTVEKWFVLTKPCVNHCSNPSPVEATINAQLVSIIMISAFMQWPGPNYQ